MANTSIEWTSKTWNPVTGCNKITSGCKNCYAEKMHKRLKAMGQTKYISDFNEGAKPYEPHLDYPRTIKKPSIFFVNSMSDLFHANLYEKYIQRVFEVMNETPWHTYQILTKRADRLLSLSSNLYWTDNIWMGVSVENKETKFRIDRLRKTEAKIKFISFEPLLENIGMVDLRKINWVIVGGESGTNRRDFNCDWARSIRDQCKDCGVAFFFKQVDKVVPVPEDLNIKQFPKC